MILTVFSGVVLGNMTRWSVWFDEAFSVYLARFNIAEIVHFTSLDVHPPLYYWLLKGWTVIFGHSARGSFAKLGVCACRIGRAVCCGAPHYEAIVV